MANRAPPPRDEQLRRDRDRKRAWRYLARGGVVIREEIGGVIGVRWARATRSGPALDPRCMERWGEKGRLQAIDGRGRIFKLVPELLDG